ncbi:hypothetical protein NC652_013040 [Populus alba x Populus x berolinensis]|nr:hypothetical protein NC652_013040 [Populus alba x Populus x berolinensis]
MNDPNDHRYRKYHPYLKTSTIVPAQKTFTSFQHFPEFLFHEESLHKRRSWSESLQYYTDTVPRCCFIALRKGPRSAAIAGAIGGIAAVCCGSGRRRLF